MSVSTPQLVRLAYIVFALALVVLIGWYLLARYVWHGPGGLNGVQPEYVMYTEHGFEPKEVTIHQGDTVVFLDRDGTGMWVASNDHPDHTEYAGSSLKEHCPDTSGLKFDQCAAGSMYGFTFQKIGVWGFHNHEHPEMTGQVTVTQ